MTELATPLQRTVPATHGLIIVNCSREKLVTSAPIPALDLYQGACVPRLRSQFGDDPAHRARIRILSAAHGLLRPDDPVATYDRRLRTATQAEELERQLVGDQLDDELAASPSLSHVLVIVEPLYLRALQRLFEHMARLKLVCIPDPWAWQDGLLELRHWGWA